MSGDAEEMISVNKCYMPGQTTMMYSTCLTYLLEEWIFLEYLLCAVICSVVLVFIILLFFTIPLCVLLFLYLSSLFLFIYERTYKLKEAYCSNAWDGAQLIIAFMWDGLGRFLNGFRRLAAVMWLIPGTKQECLKDGHLLGISPGGLREALFSDKSYKLLWKKRKGFAQLAIDAKVPIIPMYTQNVREGFRIFGQTILAKWCFESTRLPLLPPYGGFPVKFRTYIGKPIPYDPNITALELATESKAALQSLIQMHQQIPGNICGALMERFHKEKKKD